LATIEKVSKLFQKQGEKVVELIKQGKEKEALAAIGKDNLEWRRLIVSTWQEVVKEIGQETFNELKAAAINFEIKAEPGDSFDPWEETIQKYIQSTAAEKVVKVNAGTKKNIRKLIDDLREQDATMDQIGDAIKKKYKSFSRYRAFRIARTEIVGASNFASIKSAEQSGVVEFKEWVSSGDDRVRDSHEKIDGRKVPLNEKFKNGLLFPGDYSASKPAETIQCRCALAYFTKDIDDEETPAATTPKPKPAPKPKPKPKPKPEPQPERNHINDLTYQNIEDRDAIHELIAKDMSVSKKKAAEIAGSVLEWSGFHYTKIRAIQRKEIDPKTEPEAARHAKNIDAFIKKSPKWGKSGPTYRGIGVDKQTGEKILKQLSKKNGKVDMLGAASWSSDMETAENFASRNEMQLIFINNGPVNKGTTMKHLSKYRTEEEILVGKNAKYKALSIKEIRPNWFEIEVEEV
jgi:hypothetical protein